jgi:putative addiction module killer protein
VYYFTQVIEVRQTRVYAQWVSGLRDRAAIMRINVRIRRMSLGNFGDVRPVGSGVSELRINYGPGYRVYFKLRDKEIVILLCGGDKSTQDQDIEQAKTLAKEDDDGS